MAEKITQPAAQQLLIPYKEFLAELNLDPLLASILTRDGLLLNLATTATTNTEATSEIVWPGISRDAIFFAVIFQFLAQISSKLSTTDESFAAYDIEICKEFLSRTQIFQALASDKIILSQAHRQTEHVNSQEHILTTLKNLITESLSEREKFLMRVFVLMHDFGKVLLANYEGDSEALMKVIKNVNQEGIVKNSFVDHQQLSALIFRSVLSHSQLAREQFVDEQEIEYLVNLIAHHHLFGSVNKYLKDGGFDLNGFFTNVPGLAESKRWEYLLHSFLFNLADVSATRGHWPHLLPNIESFEQLTKIYSQDENRDPELLEKMQLSLELAKIKYQYCYQQGINF